MDMARFGATPRGGVNRQALTPEEFEGRRHLLNEAKALGFSTAMDEMGNLFIRRAGSDEALAPVMTGSHIDTQPSGGRFDGIYGVLAGLEALQAIEQSGQRTRRPIEVAVWTNEEGARFTPGCMGSLVFAEPARKSEMTRVKDIAGTTMEAALAELHRAFPDIAARPLGFPVAAFVEAHIEQGPVLEAKRKTVGVVTGIQGTRRFVIQVHGEDAHAGTTPRRRRKDAFVAAVKMVGALERLMRDKDDVVRFTIGRFIVSPGAPSVVPGHVLFTIDFRHPDNGVLQDRGDQIEPLCRKYAGKCKVTVEQISRTMPISFEGAAIETIERVTERLGFSHMRIPSGANHDAQNLFKLCPTGMIFVPCEKGISHNEIENARPSDLAAGARVLAETLVELANRA